MYRIGRACSSSLMTPSLVSAAGSSRIAMPTLAASCVALRFCAAGGPVTKAHVWSLWNEGNLFSLSVQELTSFLAESGKTVDPKAKKSALVREVEELMAAEDRKSVV